jgi:molybdopterin-guanine dinucleotide biosynthesis protein A
MALGAIILTGGPSRRMGVDKAYLEWGGRTAVDRLARTAREAGAIRVATVGGADHGLTRIEDDAPDGGPVAGIIAGARWMERAGLERLLVLAVDAATVMPTDLAPLLAAPLPGAAFEGLNLPFVTALEALPADAGAGWAVARLLDRAGLHRLTPPAEAVLRLRGANTPDERAVLLARLAAEGAEKGGAG